MHAAQLCDLPEELIIRIFEDLDLQDLLSCTATCRLLHVTIKDSLILQYHIQLAIAGVEDCGSASNVTVASRLAEVKAQQESWTKLRFRAKHVFPMPEGSRVWELFGGVMGYGLPDSPPTRGLAFVELPSVARGTSEHIWEHRDYGVNIRDFAIDPAQDLAVLVADRPSWLGQVPDTSEQTIYLFTMSSGENHPLAASAVLKCTPNRQTDAQCDYIIQIMAEFVAIVFHSRDIDCKEELFIWNWKTNKLVTDYMLPDISKMDSFSFLSSQHFLVSKILPSPEAVHPPALLVFNFIETDPDRPITPTLVRSFELPLPVTEAIVASMIVRSDPSPSCPTSPRPSANMHAAPFQTASSSRLLAVSLDIFQPPHRWGAVNFDRHSFTLFVHHSTLLEGLEPGKLPSSDIVVPWPKWGPDKSRMFGQMSTNVTWVCYVHGTRYVRLARLRGHPRMSRLRMLDFNPLLVKRGQFAQQNNEYCASVDTTQREGSTSDSTDCEPSNQAKCTIISASEPTIIAGGHGFADDVTTSLPYRDICSDDVFDYSAVMIDQDCLVGLSPRVINGQRGIEVLCF